MRLPLSPLLLFAALTTLPAAGQYRPQQAPLEILAEAPVPVPLRWSEGWPLVRVKVNGSDAGWFKIATGWEVSVISRGAAERLNLPVISALGALSGFEDMPGAPRRTWRRADSLEFGGAKSEGVWIMDGGGELESIGRRTKELYGEPLSGLLGWDLLCSAPFLLDYPALTLTWQKQAAPGETAVKMPLLAPHTVPWVEVTAGSGAKARAIINTAGTTLTVEHSFLLANHEKIWRGRRSGGPLQYLGPPTDDDPLDPGPVIMRWPAERWVTVDWGGRKVSSLAGVWTGAAAVPHDLQIGYSLLRHGRLLCDGPGHALWWTATEQSPERNAPGRSERPAPPVMQALLFSAVVHDDAEAVRALTAGGVPVEATDQSPGVDGPLAEACKRAAGKAAQALLDKGARVNSSGLPPEQLAPLDYAARAGDTQLLKSLLRNGAATSAPRGPAALALAVQSGNAAAVSLLQASVPKTEVITAEMVQQACGAGLLSLAKERHDARHKASPAAAAWNLAYAAGLEQALLLGHEDVVDWLVKTGGTEAARQGVELQPLLAAILPGRMGKTAAVRERMVKTLLAAKADPNASRSGISPLLAAARHGNAAIVRALLAAGARADAVDFKGRNALHRAAAANQPTELIAPLLRRGLDLDDEDPLTQLTPLAEYARQGNVKACTALLDAGADANAAAAPGTSPLSMTAAGVSSDEGALAVLTLLLERGATLERLSSAPGSTERGTVLRIAIASGRTALLEPLVKAGAEVNGDLLQGVTPLALAAAAAGPDIVSRLIELGANPNAVDRPGLSVLAHAAAAGRLQNCALLIAKGASPNAARPSEIPPLWAAADGGHFTAARLLLDAGADPAARHPETGQTAADLAASRRDTAMLEVLTKKRAEADAP
jgi:ankyrin repeat protein